MRISNKEFVLRLGLIFEFVALALACSFIYTTNNPIILFVFTNCSVAVFMYSYVRYSVHKNTVKRTDELVAALKKITMDDDDHIYVFDKSTDFAPVYSAINAVKESIKEKETNQEEIRNILNSVAVNMELDKLLNDLMPKLVELTKSNCGAFYLANAISEKLEIKYSIGFSKNIYSEFDLTLGEGFIGSAAVNKEVKILYDIPDDTIYVIRSFLGKIKPKSIMVIPIFSQDTILGTLVFASLYNYSPEQLKLVDIIKYYFGVAVSNGITYEKTKRLTNELKFQNRLIQNLNEDLEKKVQERIQFLNDIIDSVQDYAIYATDKDGIVITWSKGAENLIGFPAQDILGKNINIAYEDKDRNPHIIKEFSNKINIEGKGSYNGLFKKPDGTEYHGDLSIFARYGKNHELLGYTCIQKDITTLKKAQLELKWERELSSTVIDSDVRAIVFVDAVGIIQMNNFNAGRLLDSSSIIGKGLYEFFEDEVKLRDDIIHVAESGISGRFAYRMKNSDRTINIHAVVLKKDEGVKVKLIIYLD